jgi:hypothetical protein
MISARLLRLAAVCLLGLAVAAGGPPAAAAAVKKTPRSACQKFARSHRDLAPAARLVAAVLGDDETGRISACVLPRGKLRTLASWDDGLSRDWAHLVGTAGTWALGEEGHGDQYGGISNSLVRVDVRSGRRLLLSNYGCQVGFDDRGCPDGTSYGHVAMAASGAGAYEVTDLATDTATLQAFDPAGAFTKLADGSVEALSVTGTEIQWTQDAVPYSAPLPG